eukprot:1159048-Pelagomonas_calceolata.AAC.10
MGIRRVTSSTPCLISVMRVEGSVLKSTENLKNKHEASKQAWRLRWLELRPLKDGDIDRGAVAWRPQADSCAGCLHSINLHKMDVPIFWEGADY